MRYGQVIRVVSPTGRVTQAQIGDMTPQGPMLRINSAMIDAPAEVLSNEGWEIPDLGADVGAPAGYAMEGRLIVDALLNAEEKQIAQAAAHNGPRQLGHKPVGRTPYRKFDKKQRCTNCGSPAHAIAACPVLGNAVI